RASGELVELRARDLAMTTDEAQQLLDGLGVELEPHVLSLLIEQTEGWAAGIRLFTLAHRARGPEVTALEAIDLDERPASEYLLAEVLRRQTDETRDFLLATSVAERFTADLANAMTERSDSAHLAERLVADNVFIERLDTQPPWYRYHHLFAELLRAELRHTARGRIAELHGRAAKWHFENRAPMDAVHHALAAGERDHARNRARPPGARGGGVGRPRGGRDAPERGARGGSHRRRPLRGARGHGRHGVGAADPRPAPPGWPNRAGRGRARAGARLGPQLSGRCLARRA